MPQRALDVLGGGCVYQHRSLQGVGDVCSLSLLICILRGLGDDPQVYYQASSQLFVIGVFLAFPRVALAVGEVLEHALRGPSMKHRNSAVHVERSEQSHFFLSLQLSVGPLDDFIENS